jgi:hypothetical protein
MSYRNEKSRQSKISAIKVKVNIRIGLIMKVYNRSLVTWLKLKYKHRAYMKRKTLLISLEL